MTSFTFTFTHKSEILCFIILEQLGCQKGTYKLTLCHLFFINLNFPGAVSITWKVLYKIGSLGDSLLYT